MSKRLKGIVFKAVIVCLLAVCSFTYSNKFSIKSNNNNKQIEQIQIKAKEEIERLNMEQKILSNTLKSCCKLQIAEGSINITYNFNDNINEIKDCDKFSPFDSLRYTFKHRNFTYNATYNYNYKYNLSNIKVNIVDDKLLINLDTSSLYLEDVREQKGSVIILEDTGLFSSNLSSRETISMKELCNSKVYNYLITDSDLQNEALKSLQKAITTLCDNLKIKNYEINIFGSNTITNKDNNTIINHQEQYSNINFNK